MTTETASDVAALHALAERSGVALHWHDFYGAEHAVAPAVLRRALLAMGRPAGDDAAVHATLARLDDPAGQGALAPVVVLREGHAPHGVALPAGAAEGSPCTLTLEDGTKQALRSHQGGDGRQYVVLPGSLPAGYHALALDGTPGEATRVIVAPQRCWSHPALDAGARWWGLCVQVYALRSPRNWGIGDFTDLRVLAGGAAQLGAAFVGLNPLHALFPHRPDVASPYSPSSRTMLNPVYLDVEAVAEFDDCEAARTRVESEAFQQTLQALRAAEMVDYPAVAALKESVLAELWRCFKARQLDADGPRGQAFRDYVAARGAALRTHALFEALQAHLFAADPAVWGWPAWPPEYGAPQSPAVEAFAREHADAVLYRAWLQWLAEQQLEAAHRHARASGMPLGLYRDLAVGVNEGGSETWREPHLYALGMQVGAPPDPLNALGQNWGLPPLAPQGLRAGRYQAFIDTLRANMRHAGALRLDHVMGLMRLFWTSPEGGTYVAYPLEDLLAILALESTREHCMVIGEDLGNVAPRMREAMAEGALLSYRPLYFERAADGAFLPPAEWPRRALAVVSTHDLPTLAGFWSGDDIELLQRLGQYPDAGAHAQHVLARAQERVQLLIALDREGLLPPGVTVHPTSLPAATPAFVEAVYGYLARTPSMLVGVQLEDVTQQALQVNVPGTGEDAFPNWRRKLALPIDQLLADPRLQAVAAVLGERRGATPATAQALALPPLESARVPLATYRVQFHAGFTFDQAAAVVPYLHALGVSHLYASPYLRARAGSTHGYDITDHNTLNPEVGDDEAYERLCRALRRHRMHQMLDIVPNHMGVLQADNAWWLDVLENGPAARHAEAFDIEWHPATRGLAGRVLLPVLGDHYGRVLEQGELQLALDAGRGEFSLHYFDHRFPLDPVDYAAVLSTLPLPAAGDDTQRDEQAVLQSLVRAFATLPARDDLAPEARAARERDAPLHKRALARLLRRHAWIEPWLQAALRQLNGTPGEPASFDALDALLGRQAWRLAFWRVAGDDINYRRFFDVNTLAGVRQERDAVFEASHQRILRWVREGRVAALRVDHPDGLADPLGYFRRLQSRVASYADADGTQRRAIYLAIEKILSGDETLPPEWPVHGATGYRFACEANGLFVDERQEAAFDALYERFAHQHDAYAEIVHEAKRQVIAHSLASELGWLSDALHRIAVADRRHCDFTRNGLREALAEVAACFPVYRTYMRPGDEAVAETDAAVVQTALAAARRRVAGEDASAVDYLGRVLLESCALPRGEARDAAMRFITRWQQFTAPVTAKAVEDTAFYRYNCLVALNDVGGDPERFGTTVERFHALYAEQQATRPHWLLATSTHDSKRSEDVRTRLDVLSEIPAAWQAALERWHAAAAPLAGSIAGTPVPNPNDEYLFWQTLVGVWPLGCEGPLAPEAAAGLGERLRAYMRKAVREAKRDSSWLHPNEAYEAALDRFVDGVLDPQRSAALQADVAAFVAPIARAGCWNSLALVALKIAAPGVPDFYQGCERWNFSLVDPDNRRPVDFAALAALLDAVRRPYADGGWPRSGDWAGWRAQLQDGQLKLLATWRLLQARADHRESFEHGAYRPLAVSGPAARHVVAFQRGEGAAAVVLVVARLALTLGGGTDPDAWANAGAWGSTQVHLPAAGNDWYDALTGRETRAAAALAVGPLLTELPFALLLPSPR